MARRVKKKRSSRKSAKKGTAKPKRTPKRSCGAMGMHHMLLETSPSFRRRQVSMERMTGRMMRLGVADIMPKKPRVIPVVVHVLYRTQEQNISKAQVHSQIAVLNRDFRARNSDRSKIPAPFKSLLADTMIEFVCATRDPSGKATDGITRRKISRTSFPADDSMKFSRSGGIDAWDTERYLNIWVCPLGRLLGYAQFPGGPKATDGVVIQTTAFGTRGYVRPPYNLGRTATHEVGHYLNLRHIWGDREDCGGTDFVNDTPNALTPNYGRPAFPHVSCGNGPNGDMFMNYMDYVDDAAMLMFSHGQAARMHAALTMRSKLGT